MKGTISNARKIINAEAILTKLQDNVLDDSAPPLNQNKLNAMRILLDKAIPNLKSVEFSGTVDGIVNHNLEVSFVSADDGEVQEALPTKKI